MTKMQDLDLKTADYILRKNQEGGTKTYDSSLLPSRVDLGLLRERLAPRRSFSYFSVRDPSLFLLVLELGFHRD